MEIINNNYLLIISIITLIVLLLLISWYLRRRYLAEKNYLAEQELYTDSYFESDSPLTQPPIHRDKEIPFHTLPTVTDVVREPALIAPHSDKPTKSNKKQPTELIVVLYVVAQQEVGFKGTDIFTTLEELGLTYGNMKIFHHYGVSEIKAKQPIFSIANMLEPGTFDPDEKDKFISPGLALFMRLPGPFGGRVAFELMLNVAHRLGNSLGASLENEEHSPLEQKIIVGLRERIAHFEQRNTHSLE